MSILLTLSKTFSGNSSLLKFSNLKTPPLLTLSQLFDLILEVRSNRHN